MTSIRGRLFVILLVSTSLVWVFAAGWIYLSTQAKLERVLDARLAEAARMVSSLATDRAVDVAAVVEAAAKSADIMPFDNTPPGYVRHLTCQIWSLEGTLISRSESAPTGSMASHNEGFVETSIGGERWRIYALINKERGLKVLIGDSIDLRERLVSDVVKGLLLPTTVVLPLLALLLWISVGHGLAPLRQIATSLTGRAATDLHPVEHGAVPRELLPIVLSLNRLFGRVREARDRERSFTAFAAHELKTPLAGLKTQAQIAMRSDDTEVRRRALAQIDTSVDRTSRMARQLIDMAAVDDADWELRAEPCRLADLFKDLCLELEGLTLRRQVSIRLPNEDDAAAQLVTVDRVLIWLALRNLLENAIQHSPEHGVVSCAWKPVDAMLTISIHDEGAGILADDRDRVRERFYRASTRNAQGSGLGLSIVDMALVRMGGAFDFRNEDDGFTVVVSLPLN